MSATLSEATGRPYGIQRVCQAWERSRSALYARQTREQQRHKGEEPRAAGSDAHGVGRDAAGGDSGRSRPLAVPGRGPSEGPRAAADLGRDPVARTRVLRVMRAHKLLSPHRGRQGAARVQAGTIVTQAPNVMWGTDGVRVFTLDDGWGWIFTAVEHWTAECVGWHVCKVGSRLRRSSRSPRAPAASMAPSTPTALEGWRCGWTTAASTCPTTFLNQIRYWGIRPSYGFVEEPETNGVGGAVESHAQGASDPRAHLPEPQGGTRRSDRVRGAGTTRPGGSRSSGTTRRSRPARRTSYAGRRSD